MSSRLSKIRSVHRYVCYAPDGLFGLNLYVWNKIDSFFCDFLYNLFQDIWNANKRMKKLGRGNLYQSPFVDNSKYQNVKSNTQTNVPYKWWKTVPLFMKTNALKSRRESVIKYTKKNAAGKVVKFNFFIIHYRNFKFSQN